MSNTESDKNTADNYLSSTRKRICKSKMALHLTRSKELGSSRNTKSAENTVVSRTPLHSEYENQPEDSQPVPTEERSGPKEHIKTTDTKKIIPQQNKASPCIRKFIPKFVRINVNIILITSLVIAAILCYFTQCEDIMMPHRPDISQFNECVSKLSNSFPSQDLLLWKQIKNSYKFSLEMKRTVLCQTFITHRANRDPLDCLIRKLSQCLDDKAPYIFSPASDPTNSASLLERDLNSTDRQVAYFREITELTHPIPTVFHAICDPDHSPYKERVFLFTISTDRLNKKSGEYSHRDISNSIIEVLNKNWVTERFPFEQISAVISRIADTACYFQAEGDTFKC